MVPSWLYVRITPGLLPNERTVHFTLADGGEMSVLVPEIHIDDDLGIMMCHTNRAA